jgi:predicted unusual protein kinase regulating ubiquinone biosynthesis (AarF/ABC1/UbiB family)
MPLIQDIRPLVALVDRLLLKYRDMSLSEFKAMDIDEIGDDILEALQISPSIQIPNDFILFGRVIGMLNGLGSQLDPDTNLIEIAAPFAKQFIQSEATRPQTVMKQARDTAWSLVRLPRLLEDFLVTTSRGETQVEIGSRDIVRVLQHIHNIGRGFILSIFAAGAAASAVVFRINQFDTEARWCAGAAGILLLGAVYFMRKSRRWD